MLDRILNLSKNPIYTFHHLISKGKFENITDEKYLKLLYKKTLGYKLNLENPQKYNEKLQWLKLFNRDSLYTKLVDKYDVRSYVEEKIGSEYLIPSYGVFDSYDDIDFDSLPNEFVLKATHTSGNYYLCKDKNAINHAELKELMSEWLKRDYYQLHREWPYKNVKPRIVCEKMLVQENDEELKDYRFFCFNGEVKFVAVDFSITDKKKTRRNLYDLNWELMEETISYPRELNIKLNKPERFSVMKEMASTLSEKIPHARIDFYYVDNKIYFGEITFFHQAGMGKISPPEFNTLMGTWIDLSLINENGED